MPQYSHRPDLSQYVLCFIVSAKPFIDVGGNSWKIVYLDYDDLSFRKGNSTGKTGMKRKNWKYQPKLKSHTKAGMKRSGMTRFCTRDGESKN